MNLQECQRSLDPTDFILSSRRVIGEEEGKKDDMFYCTGLTDSVFGPEE